MHDQAYYVVFWFLQYCHTEKTNWKSCPHQFSVGKRQQKDEIEETTERHESKSEEIPCEKKLRYTSGSKLDTRMVHAVLLPDIPGGKPPPNAAAIAAALPIWWNSVTISWENLCRINVENINNPSESQIQKN